MASIIIFVVLSSLVVSPSLVSSMDNIVPALYVFGDSILDGGNSNFSYPYGVDLDPLLRPRPTNGLTIADYIAIWLRLPLVPTYESIKSGHISGTGINYAFAGSTILPDVIMGKVIWNFDEQLDCFEKSIKVCGIKNFSSEAEFLYHFEKSVFLVCFSINDFGKYINPGDGKLPNMDSKTFSDFLLRSFQERLTRLYRLRARKFVVKNIWPLGCAPQYNPSGNALCNITMNALVNDYSKSMPLMLQELMSNLDGFEYSCSDDFSFYQQLNLYSEKTGITNTIGMCYDGVLCPDRDSYLYFDFIHPTQAANHVYAEDCVKGTLCSPKNILELVGAGKKNVSLGMKKEERS